jgi:hypothetical protein
MSGIGDLIREARAAAGLTQHALAERAGTSQPAVARYEGGAVLPTLTTLERLLIACGRRPVITAAAATDALRGTGTGSARGLIGARATLLRKKRRHLLELARRCGVRNVRVFGSSARGDDRPGSDVDLLVELEPGRTLLDLAGFRREAAGILGARVDVATPDMLKQQIRDEVLAEAVPL